MATRKQTFSIQHIFYYLAYKLLLHLQNAYSCVFPIQEKNNLIIFFHFQNISPDPSISFHFLHQKLLPGPLKRLDPAPVGDKPRWLP